MKRLISISLCLFLCLAFAVVDAQADEQKPFFVHFVVLPVVQDAAQPDPRLLEFKKQVIALAGGFTQLGATSGGSLHPDGVHREDNTSFIIGAKKDISQALKTMTKEMFGGNGAFIMSWPGKVLF